MIELSLGLECLLLGALVLTTLLLPGWLTAWGLGIQGALRLVICPALSLGIWAGAVWIAIGLQLPWRHWLALPLVALVSFPFVVGRLMTLLPGAKALWPRTPQTRLTRGWWLVAVACGCMSGLPYLLATHAGARVPQTWDVVFHLSAIRYTRESASASPWVAYAPLNDGAEAYYPNVFHNIVALLPGSPVKVYVGFTLAMLLLWPLLMGAFTLLVVVPLRGAAPASYFMSGLAMLGAAMGVNFPTLTVANFATPPYTLSLLATPGLLVLGVAFYRLCPHRNRTVSSVAEPDETRNQLESPIVSPLRRAWGRWQRVISQNLYSSQLAPWLGLGFFVGLMGVACTHPASLFNLLLLLGIPLLVWLGRLLMNWRVPRPAKILTTAVALAGAGVVFILLLLPRLVSMSKFANPDNDWWFNAQRMFADRPPEWSAAVFGFSGVLFSLAAFTAVVLLWRTRRLRWLTVAFLISWLFYLLAAGPLWWGYFLTTPWYLQASRLAPLVLVCQLPLSAYGFMRGLEHIEAFCLNRGWKRSRRWWQFFLVCVLLISSCGLTFSGRMAIIEGSYDPKRIVRGTMLTAGERAFIHQQAPGLPDDAVIWGAPHEGTAYWWILEGKHVTFPSLSWPRETTLKVLRDLDDGVISDKSCQYLRQLGVTHYYVDTDRKAAGARYRSYRWLWHEKHVSFKLPEGILTKVAENQAAPNQLGDFSGQRLYKVNLEACPNHY